ncbi:hypothetical protein PBY51_003330 [Eleginops maclovinus]|uniref:Uncharacterized protein n=1 Tax=Eleginops maclovinus TaxID=56733 RepID=A0AAN7XFI0_ELEMC|nr:hypothetical protein PBY51_003330 [Eleginops maclovinus]
MTVMSEIMQTVKPPRPPVPPAGRALVELASVPVMNPQLCRHMAVIGALRCMLSCSHTDLYISDPAEC